MSTSNLLTVAQAAKLKKVTTSAIYQAIRSGRLPHRRELGHIGIEREALQAWTIVGHKAGRPKGIAASEDVKRRISETQRQNWALGKRTGKKKRKENA